MNNGFFKFASDIVVQQNVILTMRERGKIVDRREGHNIFVDTGREWIAKLIAYLSFSPDIFEDDHRIRYMGFGIGGRSQVAPTVADSSPIGGSGDPYEAGSYAGVGGYNQSDLDPTVFSVERPVRVSGSSTNYPGIAGDKWIEQIQAPPVHGTATETTFRRLFTQAEISYFPFTSVPLSEVGLFTDAADPVNPLNVLVAYDTFDTISKTGAFDLEVVWTFRF